MTKEEIANTLNENFKSERDPRVTKPDIWLCEENPRKYLVWPTNWVLSSDKIEIMMDKPNDIAIYSSIANKCLSDAKEFFTSNILPWSKSFPSKTIDTDKQKMMFNYFEKIITAIILSYTSLEALANIFIPDNYKVEKKENSGIVKIWDKAAIEQTYPLRDKFKAILQDVFKTTDPTKEDWWQKFITLEDLRNEIIHSKPSKSEERYSLLINEKVFDLVENHNKVIAYYGQFIGSTKDRNINKFPYGYGNDSAKHALIKEVELDKIWNSLTNPK